jgi:hypothetical protein
VDAKVIARVVVVCFGDSVNDDVVTEDAVVLCSAVFRRFSGNVVVFVVTTGAKECGKDTK